jgi:hypothetical protein
VPARRKFNSLVSGVPQALPDEDEDLAVSPSAETQEDDTAGVAASVPERVERAAEVVSIRDEGPAAVQREPEVLDDPAPAIAKPQKPAPGTIRLNEHAGATLWEAYLDAKAIDPFLSYRQFASSVVLDGIAAQQRRKKR